MVKTLMPFDAAKGLALQWPADSNHAEAWIGNVQAEMSLLKTGEIVFPVSTNKSNAPNQSWVVSPLAAYVNYGQTEFAALYPALVGLLKPVFMCLSMVFRYCQFDAIAAPNNWLVSTNLYGRWHGVGLDAVTAALLQKYPKRAICWRSVTPAFNQPLLDALALAGYLLIPSRQIWWVDPALASVWQHANVRRDLQLHHDQSMTWMQLNCAVATANDYTDITRLYGLLYLEKYSKLNPSYSAMGLEKMHALGILDFWLMRQGNVVVGCLGFFTDADVLTIPIVGYDTAVSQASGLYRRLMIQALLYAKAQKKLLHWSAGAASFKRLRGAMPATEYSAVWINHLPFRQRLVWRVVKVICKRWVLPFMQKRML